jgi:hypothetical protein
MDITVRSSGAAELRDREGQAVSRPDEPIADAELRLIRILQQRGRLVARAFDEAPSVQRLVQAGLIRAIERPGTDVILVLSGDGLRLAKRGH